MLETIVISPEADYPNEPGWAVKLMEAGLGCYHLRKPAWDEASVVHFLQQIPGHYLNRLVLHQAHDFVVSSRLGGWHFKDDALLLSQADYRRGLRLEGQSLSRSIHNLDELNGNLLEWDYVFLGPVFPSISKEGYGPGWEETSLGESMRSCKETCGTRVYALGGVDAGNAGHCVELGFDGVALLGAIWSSPNPLTSYLKVKEAMACCVRL